MGHEHSHNHGSKNILLAFFLNASFSIIELIGGYLKIVWRSTRMLYMTLAIA